MTKQQQRYFLNNGVTLLTDESQAESLLRSARSAVRSALRGEEVIPIFARAYESWNSDPQWKERAKASVDAFDEQLSRRQAIEILPQLDQIAGLLNPDFWDRKKETELLQPEIQGASLAWEPHGLVLHVSPGNSFLGGLESLLHGIVAGNANIIRLSRNLPAVIPVVMDLLVHSGLPKSDFAVLWEAGASFEALFKKAVDAIAVWGGEDVVRAYRENLPSGVRLVEFGPKLSFSVLTRAGLTEPGLINGIVKDVCAFEQKSCASTQVLFAECRSERDAQEILDVLALSFQRHCILFPPAAKTRHEQAEILKELERAKLKKAQGLWDLRSGYPDWLCVWKGEDAVVEPSPLFRTLFVFPFSDLEALQEKILPVRRYLQTASVACHESELPRLQSLLWGAGVCRVVKAGRSSESVAGAPHDGDFLLPRFLKRVSLEPSEQSVQYAQQSRLKELLNVARRSAFYRARLERAGDRFQDLPWLTKEDCFKHAPPVSDALLTCPYKELTGAFLFTTGGTTGEPRYTIFSNEEWDETTSLLSAQYKLQGLSATDRVANMFVGGGLWPAFVAVTGALQKVGCVNFPLGGDVDPLQALKLFSQFEITALIGLPSTFVRLAHFVEANPGLHVQVSKILYGGEIMSEPMKRYLKQVLGAELIKSAGYAAADAGVVGYQCPFSEGGVHHIFSKYSFVEICDSDTAKPVVSGEQGEIIVTNLSKKLFPVIRLKTGDRGRFLTEACVCGDQSVRMELLGRGDDMVRVGGANVFVSDVDLLCKAFESELSYLFQLHVYKVGVDDAYELLIEAKREMNSAEVDALSRQVTGQYMEIAQELKSYIENQSLKYFHVKLLPPGALQLNSKTRKLKRVLDERSWMALSMSPGSVEGFTAQSGGPEALSL